jgi:hypothetical protein
VILQQTDSPDRLPVTSGFSKLKMSLKGKIFEVIDTIKENTTKHLSIIPKD